MELLTVILVSNDYNTITSRIQYLQSSGFNVLSHYSTNPAIFSVRYLHRLTYNVTTPYLTFCCPNEEFLPEYLTEIAPLLISNSNYDILTFNQNCSFDNNNTYFTVIADITNNNEDIPLKGPWKSTYHRSLTNWCIYKSCLWQNITLNINTDNDFVSTLRTNIKTHYNINKSLYTYASNL